jgi:hypothetical protein
MQRRTRPRVHTRRATTTEEAAAAASVRARRHRASAARPPDELLAAIAGTIEAVAATAIPVVQETTAFAVEGNMERRRDRLTRALVALESAMSEAATIVRETRAALEAAKRRERENKVVRHR